MIVHYTLDLIHSLLIFPAEGIYLRDTHNGKLNGPVQTSLLYIILYYKDIKYLIYQLIYHTKQ